MISLIQNINFIQSNLNGIALNYFYRSVINSILIYKIRQFYQNIPNLAQQTVKHNRNIKLNFL